MEKGVCDFLSSWLEKLAVLSNCKPQWRLAVTLGPVSIHAFFIRNRFIRNLHVEGRNI